MIMDPNQSELSPADQQRLDERALRKIGELAGEAGGTSADWHHAIAELGLQPGEPWEAQLYLQTHGLVRFPEIGVAILTATGVAWLKAHDRG